MTGLLALISLGYLAVTIIGVIEDEYYKHKK